MTVCAVRCERGTGRRQAFSSRSVLFHRAAGLSEAWGFNARVRPHQTEEKAVDESSDVVTLENVFEKKENASRRESSFGGSVKRHPPNTNDDEKRTRKERRTLALALAAAASHTKLRKAPSRAHRATSPSRGGAAPFSFTPLSQ